MHVFVAISLESKGLEEPSWYQNTGNKKGKICRWAHLHNHEYLIWESQNVIFIQKIPTLSMPLEDIDLELFPAKTSCLKKSLGHDPHFLNYF